MNDSTKTEWPVGSPAWQEQQTATLEAIAEIPPIFEDTLEPSDDGIEEELEDPGAEVAKVDPGRNYVWVEGDQLSLVAQRVGVPRDELLEHNNIASAADIKPGDVLHLPYARPLPKDREISIEMLPEPLAMHVAREGGCKKWSFGNMRRWDDADSTGFFPQYTNLTVVAVAHVPLDEDEVEAAYYMDALSLGDYVETGWPAWMIGYMWRDLAEGHVEKLIKKPLPVVENKLREAKAKEAAKKSMDIAAANPEVHGLVGFDRTFVEKRMADTLRDGNAMKFIDTYQSLIPPAAVVANFPPGAGLLNQETGHRYIMIHDFGTKRPDRRLRDDWEGEIVGTFEYDGLLYGRPAAAAKNMIWYGIPMDMLQSHDELYNDKSDVQTRAATGTLSWSERNFWIPLAKLKADLMRHRQQKNKNKE